MSDRNEKFFSESKIKDEPKKKLSLKLGDGVVTTDKIHDGAVNEGKLSDGVNNILAGLRADTNSIGNTINGLQDQMNELYNSLPEGMVLNATIDSIEMGNTADVTLTAHTSSGGNADWKIYANDVLAVEESNISSLVHTFSDVSGDTTFMVECTIDGFTYHGYKHISIVYPVFAGQYTSTIANMFVEGNKKKADIEIGGSYTFTLTQGAKMFFAVPTSTAITDITLNGFSIPFEEAIVITPSQASGRISTNYNLYVSSNTYITGNYTVIVNGVNGSDAESIAALQEAVNNLQTWVLEEADKLDQNIYYIYPTANAITTNGSSSSDEIIKIRGYENGRELKTADDDKVSLRITWKGSGAVESPIENLPYNLDPSEIDYYPDGLTAVVLEMIYDEEVVATFEIPVIQIIDN